MAGSDVFPRIIIHDRDGMVLEGAIRPLEATVKPRQVAMDFRDGYDGVSGDDPLDRIGSKAGLLGAGADLAFALTEVAFGHAQQTDFVADPKC